MEKDKATKADGRFEFIDATNFPSLNMLITKATRFQGKDYRIWIDFNRNGPAWVSSESDVYELLIKAIRNIDGSPIIRSSEGDFAIILVGEKDTGGSGDPHSLNPGGTIPRHFRLINLGTAK